MHAHSSNKYLSSRVLKLNVGFIIAEGAGFSREVPINIPERVRVAEDVILEKLTGLLRLTRTSEGILVQGEFECTIIGECSRCLTDVVLTYPLEVEEIFEISNRDDPFVIGEDGILDLAPLIREESILNMPRQVLCQPDCKGLCPHCGQNLNEGTCDCEGDEIDSRWAALADFLKNEE